MTDHGIVLAYEVRWTWHGEREAHRFSDYERAHHLAVIESCDWRSDSVPGSREATHLRQFKLVSIYAIGASQRRTLIGTYENGMLVEGNVD